MKLFMILVSVLLPATVEAQHILMSKSNLSMTIEANDTDPAAAEATYFNDENISSWNVSYDPIAGQNVSNVSLITVFTDPFALRAAARALEHGSPYATSKYGPIDCWDVSGITNMSGLFSGLYNFNENISSWNTSAVTDMSRMFEVRSDASLKTLHHTLTPAPALLDPRRSPRCSILPRAPDTPSVRLSAQGAANFNQPLSFDTSSVTSMRAMFDMSSEHAYRCSNTPHRRLSFWSRFNSPVNFDTSRVTSMKGMFWRASAFNQPLSFDTSSVTDMSEMFRGATAYNQPLSFDTSQVTDMSDMFAEASAYDNGDQPVGFKTSRVTDMSAMFKQAMTFDQPLSFDTSKVTSMKDMFKGASSFDQSLDFDYASVIDMRCMLASASCTDTDSDISLIGRRAEELSWCIVENNDAVAFNRPIDLGTATRVTDLSGMFAGSAFNQPVSLNTSDVTNMKAMFRHALLFNQPLSFDTARVTDMSNMFEAGRTPLYIFSDPHPAPRHARLEPRRTYPPTFNPASRPVYTPSLRLARHRARQTLTSH